MNKNCFDPRRFPVFIWQLPDNKGGIYGFPAVDGPFGGIKIATHKMEIPTAPNKLVRGVTSEEYGEFYERFVKNFVPNLSPACLKTVVCSYTTTPDEDFVVDYVPDNNNILLVSACSGHGFKHSAAVGNLAAQSILDKSNLAAYPCFSLKRFN